MTNEYTFEYETTAFTKQERQAISASFGHRALTGHNSDEERERLTNIIGSFSPDQRKAYDFMSKAKNSVKVYTYLMRVPSVKKHRSPKHVIVDYEYRECGIWVDILTSTATPKGAVVQPTGGDDDQDDLPRRRQVVVDDESSDDSDIGSDTDDEEMVSSSGDIRKDLEFSSSGVTLSGVHVGRAYNAIDAYISQDDGHKAHKLYKKGRTAYQTLQAASYAATSLLWGQDKDDKTTNVWHIADPIVSKVAWVSDVSLPALAAIVPSLPQCDAESLPSVVHKLLTPQAKKVRANIKAAQLGGDHLAKSWLRGRPIVDVGAIMQHGVDYKKQLHSMMQSYGSRQGLRSVLGSPSVGLKIPRNEARACHQLADLGLIPSDIKVLFLIDNDLLFIRGILNQAVIRGMDMLVVVHSQGSIEFDAPGCVVFKGGSDADFNPMIEKINGVGSWVTPVLPMTDLPHMAVRLDGLMGNLVAINAGSALDSSSVIATVRSTYDRYVCLGCVGHADPRSVDASQKVSVAQKDVPVVNSPLDTTVDKTTLISVELVSDVGVVSDDVESDTTLILSPSVTTVIAATTVDTASQVTGNVHYYPSTRGYSGAYVITSENRGADVQYDAPHHKAYSRELSFEDVRVMVWDQVVHAACYKYTGVPAPRIKTGKEASYVIGDQMVDPAATGIRDLEILGTNIFLIGVPPAISKVSSVLRADNSLFEESDDGIEDDIMGLFDGDYDFDGSDDEGKPQPQGLIS